MFFRGYHALLCSLSIGVILGIGSAVPPHWVAPYIGIFGMLIGGQSLCLVIRQLKGSGQPPRAALFHDTWGAARALKKKSSGPRSGFLLSIISLCVELANWRPLQLQAPLLAKKVPWTDPEWEGRREKGEGEGEGARGTVHLWVSQMERTRGWGGPLYSSHTSTFFQITHIHNIIITGL